MKEYPIIFSAPMVRAMLEGRKTMTRRVVKLRNDADVVVTNGRVWKPARVDYDGYVDCPYGRPGDRLWVRENWRVGAWNENDGTVAIDYLADSWSRREWLNIKNDPDGEKFNRLWIQSTDDAEKVYGRIEDFSWEPGNSPCRVRPSIHMPREFARIVLEITDARVERLQDISETDAKAEGVEHVVVGSGWRRYCDPDSEEAGVPPCADARSSFASLWAHINGEKSWRENPWVWAISFRRLFSR
jgi:hypothetical protein